jgi:pilus assembly protein Flp/PilA
MLKLYVKAQNMLQALRNDESGQDLIEYALLGALIAVACIASMKAVASGINNEFGKITGNLT